MNETLKNWVDAARLRTLPLSLSGVFVGSALAFNAGAFSWSIFILVLITTLILQVLSNFANDYGDFVSGVDNSNRVGPQRATQAGKISPSAMKWGVIISASLALISGLTLLFISFKGQFQPKLWILLILGLAAIAAAIKYTVGKNPYGYFGLGDLMVFFFFGPVAVLGTCFLFTKHIEPENLLPAIAIGLLSTGVLNINNLRDHKNDSISGKTTLVVKMGESIAKKYHFLIVILAYLLMATFLLLQKEYCALAVSLLPLFFLIKHLYHVSKRSEAALDSELKTLSLSTFLLSLIFSVGLIF